MEVFEQSFERLPLALFRDIEIRSPRLRRVQLLDGRKTGIRGSRDGEGHQLLEIFPVASRTPGAQPNLDRLRNFGLVAWHQLALGEPIAAAVAQIRWSPLRFRHQTPQIRFFQKQFPADFAHLDGSLQPAPLVPIKKSGLSFYSQPCWLRVTARVEQNQLRKERHATEAGWFRGIVRQGV